MYALGAQCFIAYSFHVFLLAMACIHMSSSGHMTLSYEGGEVGKILLVS